MSQLKQEGSIAYSGIKERTGQAGLQRIDIRVWSTVKSPESPLFVYFSLLVNLILFSWNRMVFFCFKGYMGEKKLYITSSTCFVYNCPLTHLIFFLSKKKKGKTALMRHNFKIHILLKMSRTLWGPPRYSKSPTHETSSCKLSKM